MARRRKSFNGATAMKPWKSADLWRERRARGKLQWGHGDEAVEEDFGHVRGLDQVVASMGPRR